MSQGEMQHFDDGELKLGCSIVVWKIIEHSMADIYRKQSFIIKRLDEDIECVWLLT
jgi:hypothetical protein